MQLAAEGNANCGRESMTFSYGRGENEARLPWESDKIAKFVKEKVMAEGWALRIEGCLYAVLGQDACWLATAQVAMRGHWAEP